MKYLLISEKPSLMRAVQSAYYKARPNFDVDFIALHGHCCTLCAPNDYDEKYAKWNLSDLPIIPEVYKHKPVEPELVEKIRATLNKTNYDGLINCTDAEREGQNIFYSLYDYLDLDLPVKRFWASDLTEAKLIECWRNLRDDQHEPFLKNLTDASLLRAQIDWLIGMNFSRAISISNNENIPIGRVMSVVLAILAKREEEIQAFKPSTSYKLMVDYAQGFSGEYRHDPFKTKEEVEALVKTLSKQFTVSSVKKTEKTSEAPLLYSLGDLQNDANKEFGYSLASTLSIIQSLYEMKILSYPRTDCPYLTTGEAKRIDEILDACRMVPELQDVKLDQGKIDNYVKSKYVDDKKVQAHYAIVFTGSPFKFDTLTKEQQNILRLVAKRIMATMMPASKTVNLEVIANDGDKEFVTKESALVFAGWESLYDSKVKEIKLQIDKGDVLDVKKAYAKDVTTTCPSRYNDASINRVMINVGSLIEDKELASVLKGATKDQGGIGTPATRAGIIEKLLDPKKNWVKRKGKVFYVNAEGLDVYHKIKDYSISSPVLTAEWEQKLKRVEDGKMTPDSLTKEINAFVLEECKKFSTMENSSALKCPVCGKPIKESKNYFYCEGYKDTCNFIVGKTTSGASITKSELSDLINGKEIGPKKFTSKEGKKFEALLKLEKSQLRFVFNNEGTKTDIICQCKNNPSKLKGKFGNYYKCSCGTTINEVAYGHKFTKAEIKKLFAGQKITVNDLVSKNGKKFNAELEVKDHKLSIAGFVDNK